MSKQDNLNFLKIQNCVLKVNVHCEGCKKKVKKLLQKIDGVYTVSVDAEHGKVTVSGSVDPSTLIKKLSKAGKHAELLGPKGGVVVGGGKNHNKSNGNSNNFLNEQLQKLKLDGWNGQQQQQHVQQKKDNGKPQKGNGGGGGKDQKGEQYLLKDLKLPQTQLKGLNFPSQKDQKNVKFSLPEDFDDGSDFDDDLDDDEFDDDYDYDDDDLDSIYDDLEMKSISNKKGGAAGTNDKKGGGGITGGKKGGDGSKDSKNGEKNCKNNGKIDNKGSEKNQGLHQKMMGQGLNGVPTGQAAIAAAAAGNPYQQLQQQQYMQQMMRQQQQQQMMMMNGPTVYGQPMGYIPAGPPVYGEPYANYFSDENTNSNCSIM